MCSRLHTPVATNWHAREAQLLASDADSYISTYRAARELVYDCGMYYFCAQDTQLLTCAGITTEDVNDLTPKFWEFYLSGQCNTRSTQR